MSENQAAQPPHAKKLPPAAPAAPAAPADRHIDRSEKIGRLLDAALVEFGRVGPDGARVDTIARAAGMNKRLLYHYVGDKSALFAAVLDRACGRVAEHPETPMSNEWRVICHAVAGGAWHDSEVLQSLADEHSEGAATRLGLILLASLLPDLADRMLNTDERSVAGREMALQRLGSPAVSSSTGVAAGSSAPKPRLKLRPDLRSLSNGGTQRPEIPAAATRRDSKRSK